MQDFSGCDLTVGDFAGMTVEEIQEKLEMEEVKDPFAIMRKAEEISSRLFEKF